MSVYIWAATKDDYSAMRGPCPEGFHVPRYNDWQYVIDMMEALGYTTDTQKADVFVQVLWMPLSWRRDYVDGTGKTTTSKTQAMYWCCTDTNRCLEVKTTAIAFKNYAKWYWFLLRPFKDEAVAPDWTWNRIDTWTWNGGIYHSKYLSLISISWDWTNWITIADKNLWATTVFDSAALSSATYTQDTCWYYFQRWNNCPFPKSAAATTMSTQVDATDYWPWNYYSSPIFRTTNQDWSSVTNSNLRWWVTWLVQVAKELETAYIGDYECIRYKMNADSSGNLYVPIGWYNRSSSSRNASYNWNVSVDWWQSTNYSWTWSAWWSITLSWYTAWSSHIIKITPTNVAYWWALAYWWTDTTWAPYLTDILYDGSYIGYGSNATQTGNFFRYSQYKWCTALTTATKEMLPNWVTNVGWYFRNNQYQWCTSLTTTAAEVLPTSVTSIWYDFRTNQYAWCTSLTTPAVEVLPGSVTSIGGDFREGQYSWCTALTAAAVEVFPTTVTSIGWYFRSWQYSWCTSLTVAANEVFHSWIADVSNGFRASQYSWCTSLTMAPAEVFPSWVTTINNDFRNGQYSWCTSLTYAQDEVLPNTITSVGSTFRSSQYKWCTALIKAAKEAFSNSVTSLDHSFRRDQYNWCTALTTASDEVFPCALTSIESYFRQAQYKWCTSLTTAWAETFPSWVTTISYWFRYEQYKSCSSITSIWVEVIPDTLTSLWTNFRYWQFSGVTSLTTIPWWKDPVINTMPTYYRRDQFASLSSNTVTVTVVSDALWPDSNNYALYNSSVVNVRVPSAYLNNFKNATTYPWVNITDSKFIWY